MKLCTVCEGVEKCCDSMVLIWFVVEAKASDDSELNKVSIVV